MNEPLRQARDVIVLGGHALASRYLSTLIAAKKAKRVSYTRLFSIDADPKAVARGRFSTDEVNFVTSDYWTTLADRLLNQGAEGDDLVIPDHSAPHILLHLFFELFLRDPRVAGYRAILSPITRSFDLPFERALEPGIKALSFATWVCPVDCAEPAICPGIEANRDWDLDREFSKWEGELGEGEILHRFPSREWVDGIVAIPLSHIRSEWERLLAHLSAKKIPLVSIVATYSKCHGIVGAMEISGDRAGSPNVEPTPRAPREGARK